MTTSFGLSCKNINVKRVPETVIYVDRICNAKGISLGLCLGITRFLQESWQLILSVVFISKLKRQRQF